MFASDEQARAIRHGTRAAPPTYEWVDVPVGPQPLPDWVRGLHISWMEGYSNPPHYTVRVRGKPWEWDHVYTKEGSRYMSVASDGLRAHLLYHSGDLRPTELRRRVRSLVHLTSDMAEGVRGTYNYNSWQFRLGRGPWYYWDEAYVKLATPQQEGFGGHNYQVKLDDGREVVLRGPWHGPTPDGWVDVGGNERRGGGGVGMTITEDLLVLLIARYRPECRVARVTEYGKTTVQAVRGDWDEPKLWVDERKRSR